MEKFIAKLIEDPVDITYIAIGCAFVRDSKPENLQQFPPFLQNIYNKNNFRIRLLLIDIKFERPYFLKNYIENLNIVSNDEFYKNNLEIFYLENNFDYNLDNLDMINKIIMEQNNMLIFADYTGRCNSILENYFYEEYKGTKYESIFKENITYDFTNDEYGGCMTNLLENYPLIEDKKLIKINNLSDEDFLDFISKNKLNDEILLKIKCKIKKKLKNFTDIDCVCYRNLVKNNLSDYVVDLISKSIFKNNSYNENNLNEIMINRLYFYKKVIEIFLDDTKIEEFNNIIDSFGKEENYKWLDRLRAVLKNILIIV